MSEPVTVLESSGDLAEHFDDLAQQREAGTLGMWTFLATEVLFFGALFLGYFAYRLVYFDAFHDAGRHMYMSLGTINTVILLASSLFVALAVHAAEHGDGRRIARWLLATIGLGTAFLVIKAVEYYLEYTHHLIPWGRFEFDGAHPQQSRLFFVFYFFMTGLHAIHMIAGIGVLAVIAWLARKGRYTKHYHTPVEIAGLYWHFVDLVWVFLFPTFYLVNPH
ncbi:MAG: cytochrome c oxidase subunit III [Phycisphaerae bacterium]